MTLNRMTLAASGAVLVGTVILTISASTQPMHAADGLTSEQPSLTVSITRLRPDVVRDQISGNGDIKAWQEASIGSEADGLRLIDVKVDVGDAVRRGQLLALLAPESVEAELSRSLAMVAEAEALVAEAMANAERAQALIGSGALSAQQIQQTVTARQSAIARLEAARAGAKVQRLRLAQTRILAPDDGVISQRTATLGAVVPAGHELYRLIRGGRLEWRAEVSATDLVRLKPGQIVRITPVGAETLEGRLRMLAPVVDVATRNGIAYVDLPPSDTARPGMFARGEFELGERQVLTLPQAAVQMGDGFSHVLRVGPDSRVILTKVTLGRRIDARVEIASGIDAADRVVSSGGAFLGDGDLVRVVEDSSMAATITGESP